MATEKTEKLQNGNRKRKKSPVTVSNGIEEPKQDEDEDEDEDEETSVKVPIRKSKSAIEVRDPPPLSGRKLFILKCVAIGSTSLSVILLAIVIILAHHVGAVRFCLLGYGIIPRNYEMPGVFDDMTPQEFKAARDYMLKQTRINIVPIESATVNSSYIYMIDLHIPLKTAVLEYLDVGSIRLKRVAKVVVVRGDMDPPRVEEYLVSPLPNPRSHILARNPSYARFPIPYASRPMDQVDYKFITPIIKKFTKEVYHILIDSYGLCYHNCTKGVNCMLFRDVAPRGRESGDRKSWFWSFRDVEGFYLHPLGLEIQIDHVSADVSKWNIDRIVYNGRLFYTVEDFIDRYNRIARIQLDRPLGRQRELYSSFYRRGASEMPDPLQGPRLVEPDGRRYRLTGNHVKYMHWDFDIRMRAATGVQLLDVRFQSERIAYEISLQDAVAFSAGYGPTQSMSNYYYKSWMMGASSFELVRGVDCPDTASFLDTYQFVNSGKPRHYRNAICIFEQNPGIPLRRHYTSDSAGGYSFYGGLTDYHLTVRHITTIWNIDYIFSYMFHLNGNIEIEVATTGYVQATFKLPFEKAYGNTLYYDVTANLYQHLFHFKIDLDVGGLRNSYSLLNIELETERHPWYPHQNRTQMRITDNIMKREMDAILDTSDNPKYHIIFNSKSKNKYGAKSGYRIINKSVSEFLIDDDPVTNSAQWAKYPISVTKYDDTEDMSSSIYAQNDPWDPVVNFERFLLDNDTILDEDLVTWVTVGGYHIPQTEDVPAISTSWNKYTLHLTPFNFFTECPSISSPSAVHIQPNDDYSEINVETFGTSFESTCAQMAIGPQGYNGYWGGD